MHAPRSSLITPSPSLDLAYDLFNFEQWLRAGNAGRSSESYLFLEPRVRFEPEPDDVLVLTPQTTFDRRQGHLHLEHQPSGTRVTLSELDAAVAERITTQMDGQRSLLGIQLAAHATEGEMDAFLRGTFGRFTLCPMTMAHFEQRIASSSLVRFPGSPYELGRYYWSNMADVRTAWKRERADTTDFESFIAALKRYHVRSLIGANGRSFYRPTSPIVAQAGARAGSFYDVSTRTLRDPGLTLFIDGPRVSAPFVGGREYHELLYRSLGDLEALADERETVDEAGLGWGTLTLGRSRSDRETSAWFVPPRPLTMAHLERIFRDYVEACTLTEQTTETSLSALASFHWGFVRLHPFTCANQSLAMNLVGGILELQRRTAIPHLVLDHLALRLSRVAYARLFSRAVRAWSSPEGTSFAERQRLILSKRARMDALIVKLGQAKSREAAEQLVAEAPDEARLALLTE